MESDSVLSSSPLMLLAHDFLAMRGRCCNGCKRFRGMVEDIDKLRGWARWRKGWGVNLTEDRINNWRWTKVTRRGGKRHVVTSRRLKGG